MRRRLNKIGSSLRSRMLMPLDMVAAGQLVEVAEVDGEPHWVGRLAELGIRPGSSVRVVQPGSPCLLNVSGCKLCLRPNDCSRILVTPIHGNKPGVAC